MYHSTELILKNHKLLQKSGNKNVYCPLILESSQIQLSKKAKNRAFRINRMPLTNDYDRIIMEMEFVLVFPSEERGSNYGIHSQRGTRNPWIHACPD